MASQRQLSGLVLVGLGFVGLAVSWVMTGFLAAAVGIVTVVVLAVGVILLGTAERREDDDDGPAHG